MQEKYALVSGASRGIGNAIAFALARERYNLILICEKNRDLLVDLQEELCRSFLIHAQVFCGDVADAAFWEQIKAETGDAFPYLDVIVNNAGISYYGLLNEMSPADWHRVIDVNLSSVFYSTRIFSPGMIRRQSGHIINISSIWGQRGASCEVAYSASKGGLDAFTRALAKELAPSNVLVNAISCGVIDTDMNRIFSREEREALEEEIPMGRFAAPTEVAQMVLAILQNTYMTGQIIGIDGGYF